MTDKIATPLTDAAETMGNIPFEAEEIILMDKVVPANFARKLEADRARLVAALQSALASLDQMAKLGRIPESNQGARDARALLREMEQSAPG
jgi:hypothetical protein